MDSRRLMRWLAYILFIVTFALFVSDVMGFDAMPVSGGSGNGTIGPMVLFTGSCTESWSCGAWGTCLSGLQNRTCTDVNDCGTTDDRPALSQVCSTGGGGGGGTPANETDMEDTTGRIVGFGVDEIKKSLLILFLGIAVLMIVLNWSTIRESFGKPMRQK